MSANEFSHDAASQAAFSRFTFRQDTPIPSYLIALAAGHLESRQIGPRSRVWCEPGVLDRAAWEFQDTELFISAAEEITGFPYIWKRYDILLLPPSFPYGGMENPCLTFLTPSLLTGDRSLVDVLAHEISHSWTGNLVTAANWQHFWLNEGCTMFLERKILAKVHGDNEPLRHFNAICGLADLKEALQVFGPLSEATKLVPDLSQTDPDDVFSSIPYEKGHTLLAVLEETVGGPKVFQTFFKSYIKTFAYKSITSQDFISAFQAHFPKISFNWNEWLNMPGSPPSTPNYDRSLMTPCEQLVSKFLSSLQSKSDDENQENSSALSCAFAQFSLDQKLVFLDLLALKLPSLSENISQRALNLLEGPTFGLGGERNVEICLRWFLLALRAGYTASQVPSAALLFITQHGRMKYNRPIYRELYKLGGEFRQAAIETFYNNRPFYHPIAAAMIEKDLCMKE
jgi:hypothetical protein